MEAQARQSAVERAYRDQADDVFRVAYAILGDAEAASDATHEAFARAFERWEQYDTNRPLRPWLHAIAANVAFDALRHRRLREARFPAARTVTEIAVAEQIPAGADATGDLLRRELLEGALATLKPQVRAALVLRHYYGYGYTEIGTLLRTSPGNVGSMLSRGHADLRQRLAPECFGPPSRRDPDVESRTDR